MRDVRKLVRNGNAITITIPRQMLVQLGWLPAMRVVIELLEDNTLRIRPIDDVTLQPQPKPHLVYDPPAPVTR